LISCWGCGIHTAPEKTPIVKPIRTPNEQVDLIKCKEGYACLDLENFKKLLKNATNTETYIKQLENILKELSEPIE